MIFGSKTNAKPPQSHNEHAELLPQTGSVIFDATTADFQQTVMQASLEKPVIVDFWAPWCGPCKQLMPLLEKAVHAANGEVLLAKVNLDENPELAQALRVQSVPTVFAFFGGQPVDAFQGVVPESQIQAFIEKLIQNARAAKPDSINIEDALKTAAQALSDNDLQTANTLYTQILQQDENNAKAYAGIIRVFIAAGQIEQASSLLENAPDTMAADSSLKEAKTALDLIQNAPDISELQSLINAVENNPDDHQAKIDLAEAQFATGHKEEAIETLLTSIAIDRDWNDALARTTLLKFFEAIGHADPITIKGRKKLSTLLFS